MLALVTEVVRHLLLRQLLMVIGCLDARSTVLANDYFLLWHHHLLIETLKQALVRILIVFMLVPGHVLLIHDHHITELVHLLLVVVHPPKRAIVHLATESIGELIDLSLVLSVDFLASEVLAGCIVSPRRRLIMHPLAWLFDGLWGLDSSLHVHIHLVSLELSALELLLVLHGVCLLLNSRIVCVLGNILRLQELLQVVILHAIPQYALAPTDIGAEWPHSPVGALDQCLLQMVVPILQSLDLLFLTVNLLIQNLHTLVHLLLHLFLPLRRYHLELLLKILKFLLIHIEIVLDMLAFLDDVLHLIHDADGVELVVGLGRLAGGGIHQLLLLPHLL